MKRPGVIVLAILIIILFAIVQFNFIVREGEAVVLTRLGSPVRAVTEAGRYGKLPWPIEDVDRFDSRTQVLETSYEETQTQDGKMVLVGIFAGWRIDDPLVYRSALLGSAKEAESKLDGLIRNEKSAVIGRQPFSSLVNVEAGQLRFDQIEADILAPVRSQAKERYGLDVVTLGIHRLGVPESITEKVFSRMRAERQKLADSYEAQGQKESTSIRANADATRDQLINAARAAAKVTRAEGDAAAMETFKVFSANPEFARLLRGLEGMEEALKKDSTVVMSTDSYPFNLMKGVSDPEELKQP